ncbi:MAG: hypothetical protein RLZZ488_2327 [Pseudomonadota bacterium]
MSAADGLHDKRVLFEAQIPVPLRKSVRVLGCAQREWRVSVTGSKSFTNRAIVLAALAGRAIRIHAPLLADDTWWGFLALQQLGFRLDVSRLPEACLVRPPAESKASHNSASVANGVQIHVGQAGTLARFLPAVLLNWNRVYPDSSINRFQLSAHEQLARRPLTPILDALRELGARIEEQDAKVFPLSLGVSRLSGYCRIDGSQSGQFLSGLLLAAAGSRNEVRIIRLNHLVQPDYVRMTLQMLREFGAQIDADVSLEKFTVHAGEWTPPADYTVEADASTACYYAALACVLKVDLHVGNLGSNTLQPDFEFIRLLEKFGYSVEVQTSQFSVYGTRGRSATAPLLQLDLSRCSDQALTVGVMSLVTGVPVEVSGIAHIRHHESDRIAAFCQNCSALGIPVEERKDGFAVRAQLKAEQVVGSWPTHHDHRFALSGLVFAAWARGVRVEEPQCMQKTAPAFMAHLQHFGVEFAP